MKVLGSFQTIEHFWRIYDHMIRANDFKSTTDYHLFKDGIKPTWEGKNMSLAYPTLSQHIHSHPFTIYSRQLFLHFALFLFSGKILPINKEENGWYG